MRSWSNYPESAISSGTVALLWLVCGPGVAMYLGIVLAWGTTGGPPGAGDVNLLFAPLLPVAAFLIALEVVRSGEWVALLVVPAIPAIPWFWIDGRRRIEAFFSIALLTGLSASKLGAPRGPWPGLLHAAYVLAGCVLPYVLIRFRSQLWALVVREMAPEEEGEAEAEAEGEEEEQAIEEDGEVS